MSVDAALRRELALIRAADGVYEETVCCATSTSDRTASITFDIAPGSPASLREPRVLAREPIELLYFDLQSVGINAPVVRSGRQDFPRDLGHVNPGPDNEPASLCLVDAGLQALYDRFGIAGVMQRLRAWLRDARTGMLMAEGWEPVPIGYAKHAAMGMFDLGAFQDHSAAMPAGGRAFGVAKMVGSIELPMAVVLDGPASSTDIGPVTNAILQWRQQHQKAKRGEFSGWPLAWLYVWSPSAAASSLPVFDDWSTLAEMKTSLARVGLDAPLLDGLALAIASDGASRGICGKYGLGILVGLRRPRPLLKTVYGVSADDAARHYEVRAFLLIAWTAGELLNDAARVHTLFGYPIASPDLLSWTSRGPNAKPIAAPALLGAGALGSAVAEHLLRMGTAQMQVVDRDALAPHNLARHLGRLHDLGEPKAKIVAAMGAQLSFDATAAKIDAIVGDVRTLTDDQKNALRVGTGPIIDATADERVRGWLSAFGAECPERQIVRVELRDHGRLGVACVGGVGGNPSQTDLYAELCRLAVDDDAVAGWLQQEREGGTGVEVVHLAAGCASATVRMPSHVVTSHAAAFMPSIVEASTDRHESGIGINVLDVSLRAKGWRWSKVEPVRIVDNAAVEKWRVRVAPRVERLIAEEMEHAGAVETGGYLYGHADYATQEVNVVEATPLPPGSNASAASLRLAQAGRTARERALRRRTQGKLYVVGTWHTHPGGRGIPSLTDLATFREAYAIDHEHGVPSLFVIQGDEGMQVYLRG